MKKLFLSAGVSFCVAVVFIMACGVASQYNSKNYDKSVIVKAFERVGVNPEQFSARILKAVKYEIAIGKFTRQETIDFLDKWESDINSGIAYNIIGNAITKYSMDLLLPDGGEVSEIAYITYIMFMPDMPSFNIPDIVSGQDKEVALDFIKYIRSGIHPVSIIIE